MFNQCPKYNYSPFTGRRYQHQSNTSFQILLPKVPKVKKKYLSSNYPRRHTTVLSHIIQYIYPPISPTNAVLDPLCRGEANGQSSGFSSELQLWTSRQNHLTAEIRGGLNAIVSRWMHTMASLFHHHHILYALHTVPAPRGMSHFANAGRWWPSIFLYPMLQSQQMHGSADIHPCFPDPTPSW